VFRRIDPARVVPTAPDAGAIPFNEDYGDVYASRDGPYAQSLHVFLRGNDLPQRWQGRDQFVIVETGFGLGLNFLAAWQAWRSDPQRPRRLHFVSVEKHPVDAVTLRRWAPPAVASLAEQLVAAWPLPMAGVHRREFEAGGVTLTLALGDAEEVLAQLVAGADAFFLDGFAPDRNPAMWSARVLKALARGAREGATLATWCTARTVRDGLVAAGFELALDAGFGHKRQMLRARFAPRWRVRRHEPALPYAGERNALVIGAGLAGATAAWSLARRGWRVQVLERGPGAAAGASALPWGLLHPHLSIDDNDAARLTRAGLFAARAMLAHVAPGGSSGGREVWRSDGMLVQAADAAEAGRWEAFARLNPFPRAFAQWCKPADAAERTGVAPRHAGWWFPLGATVAARALCATLVGAQGVTLRTAATVDRVRHDAGAWIAQDASGSVLGRAPVCVAAVAEETPRLLCLARAPVRNVRGQVSYVRAPALAGLRAAISGGGTLVPVDGAIVMAGATYETIVAGAARDDDTASVHAGNLQRLARLLAAPVEAAPLGVFDGERCVARDRLPLAGGVADEAAAFERRSALRGAHLADLPRLPGLYASFALGSRGLALAPLAAEWIAAQVEGGPWPVERELAGRIDAARFLLQSLRRR
jgi:tRNA 5-methylaminomethyl-2-thiouridine biosynthesis bifunctional protein